MSFNFKKRCLEIFANIYEDSAENQNDDEFAGCLDSLLDQTLHEDENSFNLNDLLIPEVCLGNTALSVLDVSDSSKCRYCFLEFSSKDECLSHMEIHKGDDKPYQCPHEGCDSSFKARKNLKDHYLGKEFLPLDCISQANVGPFQFIRMSDPSHVTSVSKPSNLVATDQNTREGYIRRSGTLWRMQLQDSQRPKFQWKLSRPYPRLFPLPKSWRSQPLLWKVPCRHP